MNKTYLKLLFIDSTDPKTIYIQDVSKYNPDVPVEQPILKVKPPEFTTEYVLYYPVSSLIPFNSNSLGWTNVQNPKELSTLQDGLWKFNMSIKPNDLITETFVHFRIVNLKNKILGYVSDQISTNSTPININDSWYSEVYTILHLLEVAKYIAENCGKCEEAKIMYTQVSNQVDQLFGTC